MTDAPEEKPTLGQRVRRVALRALIFFVTLDVALRWTLLGRPVAALGAMIALTHAPTPPHYELQRQLDTTYASWGQGNITHVHTNRLGFRDPEREVHTERPRVVFVGDSITFGIGVEDDASFPRQLETRLAAHQSRIEVWNAGVPGYAMEDMLGDLQRRILPLHPSLIVLQLSRNDDAIPMPLSEGFLTSLHYSGLARAWMLFRFQWVTDAARFRTSFMAYLDACEAAHVPLLLLYEGLPEHARAHVIETAERRGIAVINIGQTEYPRLADDPHFNAEGNRRIAMRLEPDVRSRVEP
jgi:lysophospholipase L1-like esterase